jgi:hypothetical protein
MSTNEYDDEALIAALVQALLDAGVVSSQVPGVEYDQAA